MPPDIKILLLGTGGIAQQHVAEFGRVDGCRIVACADALPGRAAAYAKANGIEAAFESLEAAIAWGGFDAAINATPDGVHKATTMRLLAVSKHVFCEKPLAPSYPDALEMTEAAERAGLINMVNFTYRNSPALQKARAVVLAGKLGRLRHIEAAYRQSWLVSKAWGDWRTEPMWLWRLSKEHGSTGVLGDVGVHILDFATYGAASPITGLKADLVTFPKAEDDRIGDYVLDANDSVTMLARFDNGASGTVLATRFAAGHANDLTLALHGTEGALKVETNGVESSLKGCFGKDIDKMHWKKIETPATTRNAARFIAAIRTGVNGDPSFRRAAEMQQLVGGAMESDRTGMAVGFR